MRDEMFLVMLLMYGHVEQENRKQLALSSISSKLPHVGQNNSMFQAIGDDEIMRAYYITDCVLFKYNYTIVKRQFALDFTSGSTRRVCWLSGCLRLCLWVCQGQLMPDNSDKIYKKGVE